MGQQAIRVTFEGDDSDSRTLAKSLPRELLRTMPCDEVEQRVGASFSLGVNGREFRCVIVRVEQPAGEGMPLHLVVCPRF